MPYTLAYKDRFVKLLERDLVIDPLYPLVPFPVIDANENVYKNNFTASEWRKLVSCIKLGADLVQSEQAEQIVWSFLRGLHQPQTFQDVETGDCYSYPPYAPFISYFPANPYIDPNEVPSGYLFPPFHFGGIGYESTDVLVDLASFPIFANWFDIINGFLPQITITTVGDGQIELDLLSVINGGYIIIKPNSPPNILDVFAGIIDPNIRIIDTAIDLAVPSETDIVVAEEYDVLVGAGVEHTLYLTWIPALDDSSIPIRFGGGLRSVQLCGFESPGVIMGITDLRFVDCELEKFENGVWSQVTGLGACLDTLQTQITSNDTDITNLQNTDTSLQTQINNNDVDITNLQNTDTNLQAQIFNNDLDITNLQNTDTNLQAQITSNDTELADHESRLTLVEGDVSTLANTTIPLINSDISDLQDQQAINVTDISQNYTLIQNLQQYAANHEIRITQLENTQVAGGIPAFRITPYTAQITTQVSTNGITWLVASESLKSHTFLYDNAFISIEFKGKSNLGSGGEFRPYVSNQTASVAYTQVGASEQSLQIQDLFLGLSGQTENVGIEYHSSGGNAIIPNGQTVQIFIVEWANLPVAIQEDTVTFDANSDFTYSFPTGNVGTIQADLGNPENCLRAAPVISGQGLYIEIDFGEVRTLTDVHLDIFSSNPSVTKWYLQTDGGATHVNELIPSITADVWASQQELITGASLSTQTIRIRLLNNDLTSIADLRLDNVFCEFS